VVEVFARVRRELPAKLLMVGDGPDLPAALRLAASLGVAGDVDFLGEQDLLAPLLSVADVFLLPSIQESFGLAALEAMACSVPVVAARIGGLPEVIDEGLTGFLHAPEDLEGMAASALRLLTDTALHDAMSDAARRVARDKYTDDRIVPYYEHYYREILDGPAGDGR
jgi:N-acetyl-alpha-D-glucosaminyl L-malate synthase BshA